MAVVRRRARTGAAIRIAVPVLPRIANFDDLDPLIAEPDVSVDMRRAGTASLPGDADLVLLPGSKSTLADLAALRVNGWDIDIRAHVRRGGAVLGLCGGYQMLGRTVTDPDGIEGAPGRADGLGLLPCETRLAGGKTLRAAVGRDRTTGEEVRGYRMHAGVTAVDKNAGGAAPMLDLADGQDGMVSRDGLVQGCYLHGLFTADGFRHAFLDRLRRRAPSGVAYETEIEDTLDALADHLEAHIAVDRLIETAHARP